LRSLYHLNKKNQIYRDIRKKIVKRKRSFIYNTALVAEAADVPVTKVRRDIREGVLSLERFDSVCKYVTSILLIKENRDGKE
jgi:hypothetical protein